MPIDTLIQFLIATAIVTVIPGPNIFLIINESIQKSMKAGLMAALGVTMGMLPLFCLSLAGISTLLVKWTWLFEIIRFSGMGYLIYLGGSIIWTAMQQTKTEPNKTGSDGNPFLRGFLISVTNPKGLVFAGAFFPQFLNTSLPLMPQVVILCSGCLLVATVIGGSYAVFAGTAGTALNSERFVKTCSVLSGTMLVLFGIGLVFADVKMLT